MRGIGDYLKRGRGRLAGKLRVFLPVLALVLLGGGAAMANLITRNNSVDLTNGLVAKYDFTGNANDSSGNGNNGTITGATLTADRFSNASSAYSFSGTTQYFETPSITGRSVSLWLYNNSGQSTNRYLIDARTGLTNGWYYSGSVGSNWNKLYVNGTNVASFNWASLPTDQWTHIYLESNTSFTDDINFMSRYNDSEFLAGKLDDVRIYNRVLTVAEIQALADSQTETSKISVGSSQKGLVGHWKMDGDAKDSSGGYNHATANGPVLGSDRMNRSNAAYVLDGGDDYLNIPDNAALDFGSSGDLTLSAWVKADSYSVEAFIIDKRHTYGGTTAGYTMLVDTGGRPRLRLGNGTTVTAYNSGSSNTYTDNQWHHYAVVLTRSANAEFYVDGVKLGEASISGFGNIDSTMSVYLGTKDTTAANALDGSLDDVRIYNRAVTATEVADLYGSYNPVLAISDLQKGMVGRWTFDGDPKDKTPGYNHGSVLNGAALTTDRFGASNRAYAFTDNTSSRIEIADNDRLDMGTSNFTVSLWAKLNSLSAPDAPELLDKMLSASTGYHMRIAYNDELECQTEGTGGVVEANSANSAITTGQWYHLVCVYDSTNGSKAYINGQQSGSTVTGDAGNIDNTDTLRIGMGFNGWELDGSIDDVRIWNRALTAAEVQALYQSY